MKAFDLTGKRFGRLIVQERSPQNIGRYVSWECLCKCGKIVPIKADHLLNGSTRSCGCFRKEVASLLGKSKRHDLMNKKFERLLVIGYREYIAGKQRFAWECLCDCGNITMVTTSSLIRGTTKSCGCLMRDIHERAVLKQKQREMSRQL